MFVLREDSFEKLARLLVQKVFRVLALLAECPVTEIYFFARARSSR